VPTDYYQALAPKTPVETMGLEPTTFCVQSVLVQPL